MTLKETVEKYENLGFGDLEIIEIYFKLNGLLPEAIQMLTKLSTELSAGYREKINAMQIRIFQCNAILMNDELKEQDKQLLLWLADKFTFGSDLSEVEKKDAKRIFDTKKVTFCPRYFVHYILENDDDFGEEELKKVIEMRDMK